MTRLADTIALVITCVLVVFVGEICAAPPELQGTYHIALWGSDHAMEFTCGCGYLNFNGQGGFSGDVTQVAHGQSTGGAFDLGSPSGAYTVDSNGELHLSNLDSGWVSSDGSLIAWAPVPGDVPYEETGINVGIRQSSGMSVASLQGSYSMVLFSGNHGSVFSSGIGYLGFDGAGTVTFDINEVSNGQSTGEALGVEAGSGAYSVSPQGEVRLFSDGPNYFTGYISSDGSLIVWTTTPGSSSNEETGIGVAVKQGAGMGAVSLNGRYNLVLFGSDHGSEFTSGIGYGVFDGAGNWTVEVTQVAHGQSTGDAFEVGGSSGTYSVDPQGKLRLTNYDSGFVSADGSLFVYAPVPGDVPYEETGINIGIRAPLQIHPGDAGGNNVIGDFELLDYIDQWAAGQVGDFDLLDCIDLWAAGHYYWDAASSKFKPGYE